MFDLKYLFAFGGISIIIVLFIIVIVLLIYMMIKKKPSPEKPVVNYYRLVRDDVYNAFINLTNQDNIKHGHKPLSKDELFQTRVAMGIAKFVYSKYTNNIKKARAAGADIVLYIHKMSGEFNGMATGMKILPAIIANVNNNYLFELSKPDNTPESMIKQWELIN